MNNLRIGLRLESLGLPFRKALQKATQLKVRGVRFDAVGDLSPNKLSHTGVREVRNLLRSYDLELTALGCPLRRSLASPEDQQLRLENIGKVMKQSYDMGPGVVIVQAGKIPEDLESPMGQSMHDAVEQLARQGDRCGAVLALETGLESGEALASFLNRFDTASLGVNLDPANLLLHGFGVEQSARALRGKIVHADAKDARISAASRGSEEVPLGHGDIDWMGYVAVLEEIEYRGWITLEREMGEDRESDVSEGLDFLRRFVPEL